MSGRKWKPGDVAMVAWSSEQAKSYVGTRVASSWVEVLSVRGDRVWLDATDSNYFVHDSPQSRNWRSARPLVVIDPGPSADAASDLVTHLRVAASAASANGCIEDSTACAWLADRIAEQAAPPKPDEPTGLGAVVEDNDGRHWTRYDTKGDPQPWWCDGAGPNVPIERRFAWADINVARVLSEGVS